MSVNNGKQCIRIGLISDTHGLFRPEINDIFSGVDAIFHAGDIGKPAVLNELQKIAPTTAVLGNVDVATWFPDLHRTAVMELGSKRFFIIHNIDELDLDPKSAGIDAVIFGHTHKPHHHERKGVSYINPGSAGVPRFLLPVSVAIMSVGDHISIESRHLNHGKKNSGARIQ
jgi:putative phosphoesterase